MNDEWDSDDDEKGMLSKEWKRVENGIEKSGYRQGLESNKEEILQDGFDQAFKQAVAIALKAGRLQGGICASVSWNSVKSNDTNSEESTPSQKQPLEIINDDVTSLVSEIPDILNGKRSLCDARLCGPKCSNSSSDSSTVQNYLGQLKTLQAKAENGDEHLDSSFVS